MKILMAAGGTAGHINPAIAVADYIKSKNPAAEIIFSGNPNGMEKRLVTNAGYPFFPIVVHGFQRSLTPKNLARNASAAFRLFTSNIQAQKLLKEQKPDFVMGTGGYVSGPIVRKAAQMGIKTAIHEQNAYPGITNKMLAKQVDMVFLAVEEAGKMFPQGIKTRIVGNPIRNKILYCTKKQAREKLKMDDNFCILSFGGSLGASKLNRIAADLMLWHGKENKINHIHATGKLAYPEFAKNLLKEGFDVTKHPRIDLREYIEDMDLCLAAADIVICRAGAITLSELEAAGKPSILIPSPYVAENHQYYNAMALQKRGAAFVVEEKDYQKEKMIGMVKEFYEQPSLRKEFSKNASSLAILDTCERIYNGILEIL